MTRKQKKELYTILISLALFLGAVAIKADGILRLLVFAVPYFVVGWKVLYKAGRNILNGQVFDENFLMAIATVGAFVIGEYPEAVFVMLFYKVGELFEQVAVGKSRRSIAALMDIRPDWANVEVNGAVEQVDPDEVTEGTVIVVRPGERVPIDGVVIEGSSSLDTAALTGEAVPRDVFPGDAVYSGCVNMTGLLRLRTTKTFGDSTVSRILDLVENSAANKAKSEAFITRFARWYTPAVVVGAVVLAVVPILFGGDAEKWIYQALSFLVISCPCALVISVPLAFFGGIGGASRNGILVKGANYLEELYSATTVVFDKTGTLTKGTFRVTEVCPAVGDASELLKKAAYAESHSSHPIARSLREAWGGEVDEKLISEVLEQAGCGVTATVDGKKVSVGNRRIALKLGVEIPELSEVGTRVYVFEESAYLGSIVISDEVKENAAGTVAVLKDRGIHTVMLTGDRKAPGEAVAKSLGIDEVFTELLPADKVGAVESLMTGEGKVLYVGDGINDAPVLARTDVGVAMGALGSDAAIEAADVVLMDDDPKKLLKAMDISKKTVSIVRQNIAFSLAVKFLIMALGVFGRANMWQAVFADVGVMVLAVLNSTRALSIKDKKK